MIAAPNHYPSLGNKPTKIAQHMKECLTTEEAKVVYECLNQGQVVSPLHFNTDLPRLYTIREAAYKELEKMLEEEGPLNPYEYLLMKPPRRIAFKCSRIRRLLQYE